MTTNDISRIIDISQITLIIILVFFIIYSLFTADRDDL